MSLIQVAVDDVHSWTNDIRNNAGTITVIANQYMARQEETAGTGWSGDAQVASLNTGMRIHADISRLTTAVGTLVDTVHQDLAAKDNAEQQARAKFAALGGDVGSV